MILKNKNKCVTHVIRLFFNRTHIKSGAYRGQTRVFIKNLYFFFRSGSDGGKIYKNLFLEEKRKESSNDHTFHSKH